MHGYDFARHCTHNAPDVSTVVRELMVESEAVAARLGIELPISIEQRMAGAEKAAGGVIELGERLGVAMPAMHAVYACAKLLDQKRQSGEAAR